MTHSHSTRILGDDLCHVPNQNNKTGRHNTTYITVVSIIKWPSGRQQIDAFELLSGKLAEINDRNSPHSNSSLKSRAITCAEFVKSDWRS